MKKLTAEKCREHIARLKRYEMESLYQFPFEIDMREAFEIALPILEQQERGDGWIEWGGGDCPVEPMAIVEVKFTQTPKDEGIAHCWDWHHEEGENNIIAYRIIPEHPTNQNGEQ